MIINLRSEYSGFGQLRHLQFIVGSNVSTASNFVATFGSVSTWVIKIKILEISICVRVRRDVASTNLLLKMLKIERLNDTL